MKESKQIGLFITDQFSLFGYAAASEMFRLANEILGENFYRCLTIAADSTPCRSSNGTTVLPDFDIAGAPPINTMVLCSGSRIAGYPTAKNLTNWLRHHHLHGGTVVALGSGIWQLAASGLLNGRECAAHWSEVSALSLSFPGIVTSTRAYCHTSRLWTCAGGDFVTDMIIEFLTRHHDDTLASKLRHKLLLKPVQISWEQQDIVVSANSSKSEIILARMLEAMERHMEEPVAISELCSILDVPLRTLTRYCHQSYGHSPKAMYLVIRLDRARRLLEATRQPVSEISAQCGFANASHFSSAFKNRYGMGPTSIRNRRNDN